MKKVWVFGLTLICLMIGAGVAWGADAAGDYRTKATGNWNSTSTWEYYNGSSWVAATSTPTSADGVITITHAVTVTADVTVDQVVNSAAFTVSSGATLTVANGTGTDFATSGNNAITINGTLNVNGQMTGSPNLTISSTGIVNVSTGSTLTVNYAATPSLTVSSGGNLNLSGTASVVITGTTSGSLNVSGTVTMSGSSTLSVGRGNGGSVGSILSGGLISMSGTATFTNGSVATGVYTIASGGTLRMGPTALLNGGGAFTIASGANIEIGSAAGIASAGATGNIQSTGRNYNVGTNYTYNGTAAQNMGTGFPTGLTGSLTINNSGNTVTLDNARTIANGGSIYLTAGTFAAGTNLTMSTTSSITRSGGSMTGTPQGAGTYNVTYTGNSKTTGTELAGTGLNNVTVNLTSGQTLTLDQTRTFLGTLIISAGALDQGASSSLTVGGGSGTVISIASGGALLNTGTGALTVKGNVSNSGFINLNSNGNTCGDAKSILVSGGGSLRTWTVGTLNLVDLDLKEMNASGGATCYNCTDSGNNSNVTFQSSCTGAPTAIRLISFTGTGYEGGILLKWRTGFEVDNLGYHIYREEGSGHIRLTPELVAGTALLAGAGTPLTAGHSYQWWDTSFSIDPRSSILDPRTGVKYWLEDVDLKGKRTLHGPITPVVAQGPLPQKVDTKFLSELGKKTQEQYREYWGVQELKQELRLATEGRGASSLWRDSRSAALEAASILEAPRAAPLAQSSAASAVVVQVTQQDKEKQWSLASSSAVKIMVKEEGWYRISQPELVAAGLNPGVNPMYLQLYMDGKEQPILVIGESNKKFDPQDAVEFYGTGLDTPSTDTRVYWLVVGSKLGKRVSVFSKSGQSGGTSFLYTEELKERTNYFPALKNGDEDNFFGSIISPAPVDKVLNILHADPAPTGNAGLEVSLQGMTYGPHWVKVWLNGVKVGDVGKDEVFDGQSNKVKTFKIPQSVLLEGDNLITLIAQGGETDVSFLDYIRLTYWHTYTADDNALKFTVQGGKRVSIGGFSNSGVRVIDITDPMAVQEVKTVVEAQGAGYSVRITAPGSGTRSLLAFAPERIERPAAIAANQPSSWHQSNSGYDLVIISHKGFLGSLGPLKTLRESQGLSVALMDVEDLYDEFGFGAKSPQAIKDFLSLAKTKWSKPPRFVLLVGDASYDPRNYLGYGDLDFIPTKLVGTAYLETASDDWFVDFNGDGLPEMAVGRLPVHTAEEAALVISKMVSYGRGAGGQVRDVLLVADKDDKFDFEAASLGVGALVPAPFVVKEVFRGSFGSDELASQELLNKIDQGPLLVNYIGHGSVFIWGGELLTSEDAEGLLNDQQLSFFVNMTCLNGFFQAPYGDTLAEALLKADGGAVAVWASSGLTEPEGQVAVNKELVRLLFNGEGLTIGEAVMKAKAAVSDQDVRRTWILFGDPTIRLK
jgi:hypothetical protein